MKRNKDDIGYFMTTGEVFIEKMKYKRAHCDDCNVRLEGESEVMVIPFLNSAYCLKCGTNNLRNCKAINDFERLYGQLKEEEFEDIFEMKGERI